jgi:hypothetical protein
MVECDGSWFDREISGCHFSDERLKTRFCKLLKQMGGAVGQSIPLVCQDWANTKAAYRFFSNDRVSEAEILSGHFESTRERIAAAGGPILVLHDTTEFTYQRNRPELIGITKLITNSRRDLAGKPRSYTACGILMHSSLAVTTDGLPLGLGRSNSGPGTNSRERQLSKERSIRHGSLLKRKKASGGSKISSSPPNFWMMQADASTSETGRVISIVKQRAKVSRFWSAPLGVDRVRPLF